MTDSSVLLRRHPDAVQVRLADGSTVDGGFLVGADGADSAVRSALFGSGGPVGALMSEASWRFMAPDPGWAATPRGSGRAARS